VSADSSKITAHPVTLKQKFMLDQAIHPDCQDDLRDLWTLSSAVLVRPGVDLRRLRRAVHKLMERHDILRLRFEQAKGTWRALIDPPGRDPIRLIDLGDRDDETFLSEIKTIANAPMPLVGQPLIDFVIVKCGSRGDVGIARFHHAITDGYGMVVLAEDLIKLLMGMPITGKAVSFVEYLARHQLPLPRRAAKVDAFWDKLREELPKAPNIGRKAKGLEPLWHSFGETEQRQIDFRVTPQSIIRFENRAAELGISENALLFAGYLDALCQCYDWDKLLFKTHVSRTDPVLDTYAGDHTLDPILPYRRGGEKEFVAAAQALSATLNQAMEHLPAGAAIRRTPYENELIEAGYYTEQFSLYEPRATVRQQRSIFSEIFYVEYGQEQQLGPFKLTPLDIAKPQRSLYEMQLHLGTSKTRKGFSILYDGIGYDFREVRRIGDKICALLEFDLTEAIAS